MADQPHHSWSPVPEISLVMFSLRCLWIVVQLIAVYFLIDHVSPFFYQRY